MQASKELHRYRGDEMKVRTELKTGEKTDRGSLTVIYLRKCWKGYDVDSGVTIRFLRLWYL